MSALENPLPFYLVRVAVKYEDEKTSKVKTRREQYLVEAMSVTEAEAKIVKDFQQYNDDYEITSVMASKILKVIE